MVAFPCLEKQHAVHFKDVLHVSVKPLKAKIFPIAALRGSDFLLTTCLL
jgi:hypothetical protein